VLYCEGLAFPSSIPNWSGGTPWHASPQQVMTTASATADQKQSKTGKNQDIHWLKKRMKAQHV
jgi:hypothetical protein